MKRSRKVTAFIMSVLVAGGVCMAEYINTIPVIAAQKSVDNIYINEYDYSSNMKNIVEPYIDSVKETGYLDVGESDFKLYYEKYKDQLIIVK